MKTNGRVLGIILVTLLTGTALCHCPDAWTYFKGSCYFFAHDPKTFTEAEHYCRQHNSKLAKVETSDENNFLKSVSSQLKDVAFWIGLSDQDIEGVWKWTDGSSSNYMNWGPREPNQYTSANCVVLWHDKKYTWADEPCTKSYKPICETSEFDSEVVVG